MREKLPVAASLRLAAGLRLPYAAPARPDVLLGSLTIARWGGAPLAGGTVPVGLAELVTVP